MLLDCICNGEEEALVHVESPTKIFLRVDGILVSHDLDVALSSVPVDVHAAKPPNFIDQNDGHGHLDVIVIFLLLRWRR